MGNQRIAFIDIETSPNVVYCWRTGYNLTIGPDNIVDERKIICICWKEQGKAKVHSLTWDKKQCDKAMLKKFHKAMEKYDIVVGHNGDNFDIKWIKGRLLILGLPPMTNLSSIDTLKISRANFSLNSHKLDYLGQILGVGKKVSTGGFSLWVRCMAGVASALKDMVKYCKQDVVLLEKVYDKLLPHVNNTPVHMGIAKGGLREDCPSCGKGNPQKYGIKVTRTGKYQKFQCQGCGHVWADGRMLKEKK